MNYMLTGCAGFIGAKTSEFLLEDGHIVVGIDNMNDYYDVRLKEYRLSLLQKYPNFTFYKEDIENISVLRQIMGLYTFDAVINLAARAGVRYSQENPFIYMSTNAMGTLNLLEVMMERGVKKFMLASTSSLYAGQEMPFKETLPVNTPISPYAATKKAAEVMAYTYHYLYDIDVSICRYFTVYGPAGRPDMAPFRFIKWVMEGTSITLYGDGTQARDFTYVDDIARGTIAALKPVGYEIFNLGRGDEPIALNYMINFIENETGKKAMLERKPFEKTDLKDTMADNSKAKAMLGWKPQVSFDEGLRKSIQWYKNNENWVKGIQV
ncbi:MAG: GDP-mannose 4,6-dehydratase [Spirochaetaceae bacterium]|jgi:nucleoside-diphosphate-sugar epimerase|nr:GDP-mannose 4,6-dehydratase [Spirochaetaceae bacterium]